MVNHRIPLSLIDEMINGVRKFHEQDVEVKKVLYLRDQMKKVRFESDYDLYQLRAANWRNNLNISLLVSGF